MERQNTHMTDAQISNVDVFTKGKVVKQLTTGELNKHLIKKRQKSVSTVQFTERQTTRGDIPPTENFTNEKKKDVHFLEATKQAKMSVSEFQVNHNEVLVRKWKTEGCFQNSVQEFLNERILQTKHHPLWLEMRERDKCTTQWKRKIFCPHMADAVDQRVGIRETCACHCRRLR